MKKNREIEEASGGLNHETDSLLKGIIDDDGKQNMLAQAEHIEAPKESTFVAETASQLAKGKSYSRNNLKSLLEEADDED